MTHEEEELVESYDYGGGQYGSQAYGRDYVPSRTHEHGWPVPSKGDPGPTYNETIQLLIDEIDTSVLNNGLLDNAPLAEDYHRIWVDEELDVNDTVTLYFETPDGWDEIRLEFTFDLDNLGREDRERVINQQWTFEEAIDGDITGVAVGAEHVGYVDQAVNAEALKGNSPGVFTLKTEPQTITKHWTYKGDLTAGQIDASNADKFQLPMWGDPSADDPFDDPDDGDSDPDDGDSDPDDDDQTINPTVGFDYDASYDSNLTHNGLETLYNVGDLRSPNNGAYLSTTNGTVHDHTQVQHSPAGESGSSSKSSNTLFNLPEELGSTAQEVYFEFDVRLGPDYNIVGDDTDRFGWVMNREGTNTYDDTDGNGFSNAFGVTERGNPPAGEYTFFTYTYDSRGAGNFITGGSVPANDWFTLQCYYRCNDPGEANAEYTFWCNGEQIAHDSGFVTSQTASDWIADVGMMGYYISYDGGALYDDRYRYFDNHQVWVDDDIPNDLPAGESSSGDDGGYTPPGGGSDDEPDEYEDIYANGQTIRIGDYEVWENKLIHLDDGYITIVATGTGWTIRNIGIKGRHGDTGTGTSSGTIFGVADTGGNTSTMENIYFGGEDTYRPPDDRPIQIWVNPDHSGHLDVRHVNFSQWGANGIYGSAPGSNSNGNRGTLHYDYCYAKNSNHTAFRCTDNGDKITNCVAMMESDAHTNRGIWVWNAPNNRDVTIENVNIISNNGGASASFKDGVTGHATQFHYNGNLNDSSNITYGVTSRDPDHYIPEGVPTSAEEAAQGL